MHIIGTRKQEVIRVIHDSRDAMRETIAELMEDGWSGSKMGWSAHELDDNEGAWIAQNHPDVTIQLPEKGSFFSSRPYVYMSEHVRDIEEEEK